MPSTVVHLAFSGMIAAALLGTAFDRRALAIVLGVFPTLAAGAVAVFLLASAVIFHDFWAVPEEQAQDEMIHFLKNVELAGGALFVLAISGETWAYTVAVGL